jgi:hypothetical protein
MDILKKRYNKARMILGKKYVKFLLALKKGEEMHEGSTCKD